ncbi:M48 family metalloprotease [Acinetobacter sp. YH12085]|nr:M48 family metalloprotease [Acinetobacter sp. YH12085]
MAHEMAHALRDHHREKISLLFASQVAMISSTAGIGALVTAASSVTGQAVFCLKFQNLNWKQMSLHLI